MASQYFVYVLRSLDYHKSYVGMTSNIDRRLSEHNAGMSRFTKQFRPWKLICYERFDNVFDARDREKYLKSKVGRAYLKEKVFK